MDKGLTKKEGHLEETRREEKGSLDFTASRKEHRPIGGVDRTYTRGGRRLALMRTWSEEDGEGPCRPEDWREKTASRQEQGNGCE